MTPFAPTPEPEDWHLSAACRDMGCAVFFSPDRSGRGGHRPTYPAAATQACARCPKWVKAACLAEALTYAENDDHGFRGGLTPGERHQLRKAQRRAS